VGFCRRNNGLRLCCNDDCRRPGRASAPSFRNIEKALAEAGAGLADVVRVHYYVPDIADWPAITQVLGDVFGTIRPAATALVCGLVDPRMKIEIEVTARRQQP
jgi:enamine deaminase RidA (YjgF/YER057c/UK114 family)